MGVEGLPLDACRYHAGGVRKSGICVLTRFPLRRDKIATRLVGRQVLAPWRMCIAGTAGAAGAAGAIVARQRTVSLKTC